MQMPAGMHERLLTGIGPLRQELDQQDLCIVVDLSAIPRQMPPEDHVQVLHQVGMEALQQLERELLLFFALRLRVADAQVGHLGIK